MGRLFGTDGVRGLANGSVTAELALGLAVSAARVLGSPVAAAASRSRAVVGRDPRASGDFLEAAVVAGLASAGVDVLRLGVVPTPAVAYLTGTCRADFGVMLSASHNPMADNGIKFFAAGGHKLEDSLEDAIEDHLGSAWKRPVGDAVGRVTDLDDALQRYADHLREAAPTPLTGLRVVLDCADGAASLVAPDVFASLGAEVVAIHASPDGLNINEGCGSTHLQPLRAAVVQTGADAGFAFDGDADRVLAADAAGRDVDGDQLLAILALSMDAAGALPGHRVVATVMSNLGLLLAMRAAGLDVLLADVGDRYVLEMMRDHRIALGGEQSGHLILGDHATTGDGILAALTVAARMASTGTPLAELAGVVERLPQVLVNVAGVDKTRAAADLELADAVARAERELGDGGRVLLRPSGTEPLIRVMVEARSRDEATRVAEQLAGVVRRRLAL
ncbi:MAG: phosphoglucosamine mutase [Nocardioidaceae bacterium]